MLVLVFLPQVHSLLIQISPFSNMILFSSFSGKRFFFFLKFISLFIFFSVFFFFFFFLLMFFHLDFLSPLSVFSMVNITFSLLP